MGGRSSKGTSRRQFSFGSSSSFNEEWYPPPPPPQQIPYYTPQHHHASSSYGYAAQSPYPSRNLDTKYSRIADNYQTLEQVTDALAYAGLESSNLIVGIDFTKSNEWTGSRSFHRRSLHHIGNDLNPYEQAISIIGKTLSAFDEDNLIPCFGFGDGNCCLQDKGSTRACLESALGFGDDLCLSCLYFFAASTHDQDVFSFYPDGRFCDGFEQVLRRYREIVPHLRLSGPTSFAPIIEMATSIVEESGSQYHVLLLIADGQVTRSIDTPNGHLSPQERKTIDAIVKASEYPLSIILVGVGDGPWDMMRDFDDNIPARAFDNFQFVNFTEIMSKKVDPLRKQTEFALAALMEIPSQYKATIELNILGQHTGDAPNRVALPPPLAASLGNSSKPHNSSTFQHSFRTPLYPEYDTVTGNSLSNSVHDIRVCPICLTNLKDMAFGCGHQTCCECGEDLGLCPICRAPIKTRIKLY